MLVSLAAATPGRAQEQDAPVTVFAAASLAEALGEIARDFEAETGYTVRTSLAGSSVLARQILLGAPADLFISADPQWADALIEAGRVEDGRRANLVSNRLVLVARAAVDESPSPSPEDIPEIGPDTDLSALLGDGRLAVGLTSAVPAGRYAEAALRTLGHWDMLANRLAQTDNVRAALSLVATGAVPLGIVYATDAAAEPRVRVLGVFPEHSHPPIIYPLVDLSPGDTEAENAFFGYLAGEAARARFEAHGFLPVSEAAP